MHTTRLSGRLSGPSSGRRRTSLRTAAAVSALGLSLTTASALAAPTPSTADAPPSSPVGRVVAEGLAAPFGLAVGRAGSVLVAEAGAGQVTRVDRRGRTSTVVSDAPGVAGVASRGPFVWSVLGGPPPPDEQARLTPGAARGAAAPYAPTSVLRTNLDTGRTVVIADLEDHELAENPDGQQQLVDGVPVDALSNPFSMTLTPRGLLVADGGANDVLRVDPRTGEVTTFFVPPNPRTPECLADDAQANPGTVGCDSVPTGVAYRGGAVYVSTLGSERPGAGRIYRLSDRTGRVQRVWDGLDSPTGVAVGRHALFYSQVFGGQGGQVVKVDRAGRSTAAAYPTPTGLLHARGRLWASIGSLSPSGSVVVVPRRAFVALPQ